MKTINYAWQAEGAGHELKLVFVSGTAGHPFLFGEGDEQREIELQDFYIGIVPVTQTLWKHVMGGNSNPSVRPGDCKPVENVSWNSITRAAGFLGASNASEALRTISKQASSERSLRFRLPSETEWEYAARGGPHWKDGFPFSGGREIDAVAWYQGNSGDHMHEVAEKAPNQLGIYDMSGNAWEWCQDCYTPEVTQVPADGSPFKGKGAKRVLRGGCFHNWAIHCTVSKRYEIARGYHDGCIGFRLVLA